MSAVHPPKLHQRNKSTIKSGDIFRGITVVALPVRAGEDGGVSIAPNNGLDQSLSHQLRISLPDLLARAPQLSGKAGEIFDFPLEETKLDQTKKVKRIIFVGIGSGSISDMRKAGAAIGRRVKGCDASLLSGCAPTRETVLAHVVSLALSLYSWNLYSKKAQSLPEIHVWGNVAKELDRAQVDIESVWLARDLVHTPANIATPAWLASQAKKYSNLPNVSVKVRAGKELKEFGGLTAVGNSSQQHPPRFIEVSYSPRGAKKHVALVGKGITFDTGGISLKRPYDVMMTMKTDMAGAASVLATVVAAAKLKLPIKVSALMMCAENLVSETAQRPSDVITHYGGTTVEVIDTDAEGRLVLADGLAYADLKLKPDYLIDVATLTGAAKLGLGLHHAALYCRDSKLAKTFVALGDTSGDRSWHMPLVDDYQSGLESFVADFNHTADKDNFSGGSITAALFLEKFVGKRKWVHLDIAGPARSERDEGENPKGGTGFSVRLLTHWLETL
jgi:leucyl aminopeptidase